MMERVMGTVETGISRTPPRPRRWQRGPLWQPAWLCHQLPPLSRAVTG